LDEDQWDIAGLDAMHQTLHVIWGGGGDYPGMMTGIPFASFDPVFPVFHAYFDLLLHIWQQRNPDVWVDSGEGTQPGFDARTPPFWHTSNATEMSCLHAMGSSTLRHCAGTILVHQTLPQGGDS
jgi:hypothetical protein